MSFYAAHAETLVANGYSPIPIMPGGKAPGFWTGKEWREAHEWQDFCTRTPLETTVAGWALWPDAGVGIACGNVVGIDIDTTDPALSQRAAELARIHLGDSPAIRIGNRPKQLIVYRCDTPFASFNIGKYLQVIALGRQFVAYGIHPVTGQPYDWPLGSLTEFDIGQLPAVDEEKVRAWAAHAAALFPQERAPRVTHGGTSGDIEATTPEAVAQALGFIPSDGGTSYGDWIDIGMAIHAGLGEAGRTLWHDWSARDGTRYDAKVCDRHWNSFGKRAGGSLIGPGTLFDRAMLHGWSPTGVDLYPQAGPALAIDVAAISAHHAARKGKPKAAAAIVAEPVKRTRRPLPAGWREGLSAGLGAFVDHCEDIAISPQPWIALGAAIATFGTLAGRRYQGPTGLRTNFYSIGVGESTCGKNVPLGRVGATLLAIDRYSMMAGSKIASGQALVSALEARPSCIFAMDEFGQFMQGASDRKRAPKHVTDVIDNLTEFYSMSGDVFGGTAFANAKERPTVIIQQPNLSIFAVTTPAAFWAAFNSASSLDGSLARYLIFQTDNSFPDENETLGSRAIPATLKQIAEAVVAGASAHKTFPMGEGSAVAPNPFTVDYHDDEARAEWARIRTWQLAAKRESEGTKASSIVGRIAENAAKLALIHAVTEWPAKPTLTVEALRWGMMIARYNADIVADAIDERMADNDHERNLKLVLRLVIEAGAKGIGKSELTRRTQSLDGRTRAAILTDLIESDLVRAEAGDAMPNGKRPVAYFAA